MLLGYENEAILASAGRDIDTSLKTRHSIRTVAVARSKKRRKAKAFVDYLHAGARRSSRKGYRPSSSRAGADVTDPTSC